MSKRDEYFEKMKQQLDELNAHIGELETKVQAGQEGLENKAQEQITHLREVYTGMKARLDEITNAGYADKGFAFGAEGFPEIHHFCQTASDEQALDIPAQAQAAQNAGTERNNIFQGAG